MNWNSLNNAALPQRLKIHDASWCKASSTELCPSAAPQRRSADLVCVPCMQYQLQIPHGSSPSDKPGTLTRPGPEDLCTIMYTSGTTGEDMCTLMHTSVATGQSQCP